MCVSGRASWGGETKCVRRISIRHCETVSWRRKLGRHLLRRFRDAALYGMVLVSNSNDRCTIGVPSS